jgi:hypothetical protein
MSTPTVRAYYNPFVRKVRFRDHNEPDRDNQRHNR